MFFDIIAFVEYCDGKIHAILTVKNIFMLVRKDLRF